MRYQPTQPELQSGIFSPTCVRQQLSEVELQPYCSPSRKRRGCLRRRELADESTVLSQKGPTPKKSLRFATQLQFAERPSDCALSPGDITDLWWTAQELQDIADTAHRAIAHQRYHRKEQQAHFLSLFSNCARWSGHEVCHQINTNQQKLVHSSRGLERQIHDVLLSYRSQCLQNLLEVQSKVPSDMDSRLKARLLCAKSLQWSKPSRNLALFLACQDALEVVNQAQQDHQRQLDKLSSRTSHSRRQTANPIHEELRSFSTHY